MPGHIRVIEGMSMMDAVIAGTGSLEAAVQFCWDNSVSISDTPTAGAVLVVSDAAAALGDRDVLREMALTGFVPVTLGLPGGASLLNDETGEVLLNDETGEELMAD